MLLLQCCVYGHTSKCRGVPGSVQRAQLCCKAAVLRVWSHQQLSCSSLTCASEISNAARPQCRAWFIVTPAVVMKCLELCSALSYAALVQCCVYRRTSSCHAVPWRVPCDQLCCQAAVLRLVHCHTSSCYKVPGSVQCAQLCCKVAVLRV